MTPTTSPSAALAAPAVAPASLPSGWKLWLGRVLTALPILALTASAGMKLMRGAEMVTMLTGKFGYPENTLLVLAIVELTCVVLYAIPRTSILGAILMTGYLGGAVATHVRVTDNFVAPLILGVIAWAGLYLRDLRLQALLPLRQPRS